MQAIEFGILLPALLAGLLVTATHVPLGIQVLRRGIVFIDIAIAQIAGVGVIAADFFGLPYGRLRGAGLGADGCAERRAVHDVDGTPLAGHSGRHHRHGVRARGDGAGAVARRQCPRRRIPEGSAGRPDPVGELPAARRRRRF